jgi:hypothetical protein
MQVLFQMEKRNRFAVFMPCACEPRSLGTHSRWQSRQGMGNMTRPRPPKLAPSQHRSHFPTPTSNREAISIGEGLPKCSPGSSKAQPWITSCLSSPPIHTVALVLAALGDWGIETAVCLVVNHAQGNVLSLYGRASGNTRPHMAALVTSMQVPSSQTCPSIGMLT